MTRYHTRIAVAIVTLLLLAGLIAQHRWDAQCAVEQPGTHWNGDDWLCESSGR